MSVDDVLRQRAAEGLRITLFPTPGGHQASVSEDGGKSWRVEIAPDPATALKMALGVLPGAAGKQLFPQGSVFE